MDPLTLLLLDEINKLRKGEPINISGGDYNDLTTTGYYTGNNVLNGPDIPARYFHIIHLTWGVGVMYQVALRQSPSAFDEIYVRTFDGGNWNTWKKVKMFGNANDITRQIPSATSMTKATYTKVNGISYTVKNDCNLEIKGILLYNVQTATNSTVLLRYGVNNDWNNNDRFLYSDQSGTGKPVLTANFLDVYKGAKKGEVITLWAYVTMYDSAIPASTWNHVIFEEK